MFGEMKLGKKAVKLDHRTLKLSNYLGALPPVKPKVDWTLSVKDWPMMENDKLGDCTCAAAGHMIELWTANIGKPSTPSDSDIISAYSAVSGYVPGDSSTDNGAVELDVLNYWRKIGVAGHQIMAFVAVNVGNQNAIKTAIDLFGGCYIGVQLPLTARDQKVWDLVSEKGDGSSKPGSWGGHAVPVVGYDKSGLTVVTWGALMKMTWRFWVAYCDEAYGVLSQDWFEADGKSPEGFDLSTLQQDLQIVTA